MQVTRITAPQFNRTAFKSNMTFDIGGSQREGSCKIYYATSDDDKQIYTARTTVNTLGKNQFESSEDFIKQIISKVKAVQDNNKRNVKDMGYDKDENILRSLTIFIPSYTDKRFASYLPNHKNLEDKPLKALHFDNIEQLLLQEGVKISKDFQFRLLQDAMGTGLAMAKKLYDKGMLEEGKLYTACITGGGCGISTIRMQDNDFVAIESSGSACIPVSGRNLEKVSHLGASAPAIIENFCRTFKIDGDIVFDIKNCSKAEFTLNNPVTYEKDQKTDRLRELLVSTGKYDVTEDEKKFTLTVKKEYEELFNMSRESAIDQYCDAFAQLASEKINDGSNGFIITGALANAVNKASIEHYNKPITQIIEKYLSNKYRTDELDKLRVVYGFKLYCDDSFAIDDNTACKKLAHQVDLYKNRGNWIKLPIKTLQETPVY
ncbi:MAG: hypothetical protein MJ180_02680 [Candidatus Gastranaerophilales bacterium]|nr:hypothetical protein [Candidatus Gastranaerophilales bacterium]